MPRRGPARKRKVEKDPVYKDMLVAKLINRAMYDGKKSVTQTQVYGAFELVQKELGREPLEVFHEAINSIKPTMEVRPRRIGGAAYQVPVPVRGPRQDSLAIRWIIEASRGRSNSQYHTYAEKLAAEITDAIKGEGGAVKKREEMERIAEANRAFAHFRW